MNTDQAYQDGYDAFSAKKKLKDNPHKAWNAYDAWGMGWLDARDNRPSIRQSIEEDRKRGLRR